MPNSPILFGGGSALNIHPLPGILDQATGRYRVDNGPQNLIGFNNFENNATTGWSLGTTGTLTNAIPTGTPTFGSGTTSLSIATASTTPINGTYSLSYVGSAATTAGNMLASDPLTVQPGNQSKVLTFKFSYQAFSGASNGNFSGTSSNSFGVACYDVTNSSWLPVAGNFAMTQNSGVGIATGTMQTNATTASVRFIVYNANASAGAITMYFDDFYLGPQTAPIGAVITNWTAYTPTFSNFGTVSAVSVFSRRVGQSLEVQGTFTAGTPVAAGCNMTIGFNGANSNVTQNGSLAGSSNPLGHWGTTNTNYTSGFMTMGSGSTINFAQPGILGTGTTNGAPSLQTTNGNLIGGVGNVCQFQFSVPITSWDAQVQMSSDTDTRVVAAQYAIASGVTSNATPIVYATQLLDTHGAYSTSTGQYTVPVSGSYRVSTAIATTASSPNVVIYKNGSPYATLGTASSTAYSGGSATVSCRAGDLLDVRCSTSTTVLNSAQTILSIERLSGPSVIAATESVNMRYTNTSAQSLTNVTATTITNWTKDYDSNAQFNPTTGIYTVPVSGKYQVSAIVNIAGSGTAAYTLRGILLKNGSTVKQEFRSYPSIASPNESIGASDVLNCNAGDTIAFQVNQNSGLTQNLDSTAADNVITIYRVGN